MEMLPKDAPPIVGTSYFYYLLTNGAQYCFNNLRRVERLLKTQDHPLKQADGILINFDQFLFI
jgi:hypothetical protein